MTNSAKGVWQLAGGPASRPFVDRFLKFGVGLIGPGDSGPWVTDREDREFAGGFVRRFAAEIKVGDILLLRAGISTICAVGIVASEYMYLNQFDDVNGWDLQHARRARWRPLPVAYSFSSPVFGANPSRCSRVRNPEVVEYARRFVSSSPVEWQSAPLPDLPEPEQQLDVIPTELRDVVGLALDLSQLYGQREYFGDLPAEDEIVGHLVIPFLKALGWRPEHIGIKWRFIDVALFERLPRVPENVRFVIEAKQVGTGIEGALEQARGYIQALRVPRDVVVTDGIRYRMYSAQSGFSPVAYANLSWLKATALQLFSLLKRS